MNRLNFIRKSSLSAAGLGLGLTYLIRKNHQPIYGQTAPSKKVNIALIGCHSMGYSNLQNFLKYLGTECLALCDINDEWLYKRTADVEQLSGKKVPFLYKDWHHVIDNKEIEECNLMVLWNQPRIVRPDG